MQKLQRQVETNEVTGNSILENILVAEERKEPQDLEIQKRLESLGLKSAAKKVDRARKMMTAYRLYQYIPQEKIDRFNQKLHDETLQEDKRAYRFKKLMFIPLEQYDKIPTPDVLARLEKARADNCFDSFEVTKIDWIEQIKDPILFGRIKGCPDRFFIAQWDDDISIEDLLLVE